MNTLILNRETFEMPGDGWYQIAPLGEFPHGASGVVQVVDADACDAMINAFRDASGKPNFAGLLIDFDHFSLDDKLKSEAAGWIVALEARGDGSLGELRPTLKGNREFEQKATKETKEGATPGQAGLWAKIRWSDVGEDAVKGGRYRFLSPVWARKDCVDLGNGRVRPVRLLNAAVTNDPNLKGMVPLSNRAEGGKLKPEIRDGVELGDGAEGVPRIARDVLVGKADGALANAGGVERFRWVLGESPDGRHCPSCEAMAGQVHTMAEWDASGVKPGSGRLYCKGNCHCRLEQTDEQTTGGVTPGPLRKEGEDVENRGQLARLRPCGTTPGQAGGSGEGDVLPNVGWTEDARAASLAVRQAKSARRAAGGGGESGAGSDGDGATGDGMDRDDEIAQWTDAMESYWPIFSYSPSKPANLGV